MLVACRMILKRSKDTISEFFVKGSRLKTERVEECIGAGMLNRIKFRTLPPEKFIDITEKATLCCGPVCMAPNILYY